MSKEKLTIEKEICENLDIPLCLVHHYARGQRSQRQTPDEYYCVICGASELDLTRSPQLAAYIRAWNTYKNAPLIQQTISWHRWIEEQHLAMPDPQVDTLFWNKSERLEKVRAARVAVKQSLFNEFEASGTPYTELDAIFNQRLEALSSSDIDTLVQPRPCHAIYHGAPCPRATFDPSGFCAFHREPQK
jgi:hypothetical protein